jgi:hypothetical protein
MWKKNKYKKKINEKIINSDFLNPLHGFLCKQFNNYAIVFKYTNIIL